MHMADALVAPAVAATMYVCSGGAAGFSVKKVRLESDPKKIPVMGVMGAFVFAAQMINFTIPGTGSSGHLCGGMMLTALLGPYAAFLTMIGVLLIQCLLFADGGLLALGCNIWNMAFYGCFVGGLIWRAFTRKGLNHAKIIAASLIGCIFHPWVRGDAAAWCFQCGAGNTCIRYYGSAVFCICGNNAADSSRDWSCRRPDYSGRSAVRL